MNFNPRKFTEWFFCGLLLVVILVFCAALIAAQAGPEIMHRSCHFSYVTNDTVCTPWHAMEQP